MQALFYACCRWAQIPRSLVTPETRTDVGKKVNWWEIGRLGLFLWKSATAGEE
jgi:hypothetical protein